MATQSIRNYSQKRKKHIKNITIIGDSISYRPGYASTLASMYNSGLVNITNWAFSAGKVLRTPPYPYFGYQVVSSKFDNPYLVLILLGVNDNPLDDFFPIEYGRNLSLLKEYHPNANIVCLSILNTSYDESVSRITKNQWIQSTCASKKINFVDTNNWINSETDTSDGIHPTDAGYVKIITRLLNYI